MKKKIKKSPYKKINKKVNKRWTPEQLKNLRKKLGGIDQADFGEAINIEAKSASRQRVVSSWETDNHLNKRPIRGSLKLLFEYIDRFGLLK